ncbi:MAG: NADH-quinone oxidoreductase subunit H [Candidatus Omnitrophica bacterium]|nr:NADH-quinone oxidoreductase subunit H [Candidatus Omnitrophota bacterium]MCM8794107.1 NADH-quinone oxidoreductase subunit H [Candidatus Omnitrophota bacterium]
MLRLFFNYLIFPGFLFTATMGLLVSWIDRKITARVQWRKGPPWYQNFLDLIKLMQKEIVIPGRKTFTFIISPFLGLISVTLVASMLGKLLINPHTEFIGDLIVVIYLLLIPGIALILGGSSSGNPLGSVGSSREMKLILAYELPSILAVLTVLIKTNGIRLTEIINHQMVYGPNITSISGFIAFLVTLICYQAKLGFVPFDISEAEQEIMGGVLIEYSGLLLGIFKLTRMILLYIMPLWLIILFWSNNLNFVILIWKYFLIFLLVVLIKNTSPRLRIDQALKFFWGPVTILGVIAIVLALLGY